MLQTGINSEFYQTMDLFNEIDDLNDLFSLEKNSKLDSVAEDHEDLRSKYSSLHENYAKEIENSKKVEKCLVKCLKFYSKLCKKYEVQQKVISNLEESLKEKISSLEEAQKNEERIKGLIEVYRTERTLYAGQTNSQLRKDKELLLEICCKLISESVKSSTTRNFTHLLLRKFKKDLDDEKLNMLKGKYIKLKDELDFGGFEVPKSEFTNLKNEIEFKSEDKCRSELTKVEVKDLKENSKSVPLDLSLNKTITEDSDCLDQHSNGVGDKKLFVGAEKNNPDVAFSLPSLEEELSTTIQIKKDLCQNDVSVDANKEKCHLAPSENRNFETDKSNIVVSHLENITESSPSEKYSAPFAIAVENDPVAVMVRAVHESPTRPVAESGSIFDVSDLDLTVGNQKTEIKQQESVPAVPEEFSGIFFEKEDKSEVLKTEETNVEFINSEEESVFPYEKELFKIFREMSSIRLLSPIRECTNSSKSSRTCEVIQDTGKNNCERPKSGVKRNSDVDGNSNKSKKPRAEEEKTNCNLLDSIMSAMSIQNEEFKAKGVATKEVEKNSDTLEEVSPSVESPSARILTRCRKPKKNLCSIDRKSLGKREANSRTVEKLVMEEIRNFVLSPISSKEEADKNVRHCLSVLSNKSEDVIAKCIVAIILENVDEEVENFERPSPPLTKTQHRLIVLLSVFQTLESKFQNISGKILSIISEKLFPDNFFWPDDCVEAATRFYAALCKARNNPKTLWKFCLQGMTEMRQRCPLLMLTALKTWPDVLHDAPVLKNNILAVTVVNIFLHMPKKEGLRNFNQSRKLVALKHLFLNFYKFRVEDTIENYAKSVLDSVFRQELGSEKSIVLLSKCRDQSWTAKNILPVFKAKLADWAEGRLEDSVASRILSVIKQISPTLHEEGVREALKSIGLCLSKTLASGKKSHDSEVNIVEVLLQLKQYPEVRKVIREWIPKNPIDDMLRNEIIQASAENILRELKLDGKKKQKHLNFRKKLKKQSKKSKKKKLKGKKMKKSERKSKESLAGVSS